MNLTPHGSLLERLRARRAVVGIFGLGYVGLPLALRFAEVGYPVLGFDIDAAKVEALNARRSYIAHIPAEAIARARGVSRRLNQACVGRPKARFQAKNRINSPPASAAR